MRHPFFCRQTARSTLSFLVYPHSTSLALLLKIIIINALFLEGRRPSRSEGKTHGIWTSVICRGLIVAAVSTKEVGRTGNFQSERVKNSKHLPKYSTNQPGDRLVRWYPGLGRTAHRGVHAFARACAHGARWGRRTAPAEWGGANAEHARGPRRQEARAGRGGASGPPPPPRSESGGRSARPGMLSQPLLRLASAVSRRRMKLLLGIALLAYVACECFGHSFPPAACSLPLRVRPAAEQRTLGPRPRRTSGCGPRLPSVRRRRVGRGAAKAVCWQSPHRGCLLPGKLLSVWLLGAQCLARPRRPAAEPRGPGAHGSDARGSWRPSVCTPGGALCPQVSAPRGGGNPGA